jgi:hypothetical protein
MSDLALGPRATLYSGIDIADKKRLNGKILYRFFQFILQFSIAAIGLSAWTSPNFWLSGFNKAHRTVTPAPAGRQ